MHNFHFVLVAFYSVVFLSVSRSTTFFEGSATLSNLDHKDISHIPSYVEIANMTEVEETLVVFNNITGNDDQMIQISLTAFKKRGATWRFNVIKSESEHLGFCDFMGEKEVKIGVDRQVKREAPGLRDLVVNALGLKNFKECPIPSGNYTIHDTMDVNFGWSAEYLPVDVDKPLTLYILSYSDSAAGFIMSLKYKMDIKPKA